MTRVLSALDSSGSSVGTVELDGDKLTSANPSLREIAERFSERYKSPSQAFAKLSEWGNGYLTFTEMKKSATRETG